MSKVCLLGASLETANMGVSALAISFVKIMRHIDKEMDVSLLIGARNAGYRSIDLGDDEYKVKIVNYRMSPKALLQEHILWILFLSFLCRIFPNKDFRGRIISSNPWLKEIEESAFVGSIHGGDSFSDIYGLYRFFMVVLPNLVPILLKKPLILLPQTYGPYDHAIAEEIARYIIKKSCVVLCRDKNGPQVVRKILGNADSQHKVAFCPDVAFFLHSNPMALSALFPINEGNRKTLIGINVNGLMYKGGYNRKNMFGLNLDYGSLINKVILKLLSESDANIILIPHNNAPIGDIESDFEACGDIIRKIPINLNHRIRIMEHKHSPSEIKGVISKCDFFIGSRMHACIAGLSLGIPAIGIAYSEKFVGVFESIGADQLVVDARSVTSENALSIIWDHYNNRNTLSALLKFKLPDIHKTIIETFSNLGPYVSP